VRAPTGSPLVQRTSVGHALNTKAVARRYAREQAVPTDAAAYCGAPGQRNHRLGHQDGRMIDSNSIEEGRLALTAAEVAGAALVKLCFSGKYTQEQLDRHVFGDGGLFAYLVRATWSKWNGASTQATRSRVGLQCDGHQICKKRSDARCSRGRWTLCCDRRMRIQREWYRCCAAAWTGLRHPCLSRRRRIAGPG